MPEETDPLFDDMLLQVLELMVGPAKENEQEASGEWAAAA